MKKTPLKRTTPLKSKKTKPKKVSLTKLKEKIWGECKRIIRARYISGDGQYRCFTCGAITEVPHTGHIITSSTCSTELRYSLDNLRLQCYSCNIHKSGNWVEFKKRLGDAEINRLIDLNDNTKGNKYGEYELNLLLEKYKQIEN